MARPHSDHFDGKRFRSLGGNTDRTWRDMVHWARTNKRVRWPSHLENGTFDPPARPLPPGAIASTFIGHSTFLVRTDCLTLLTDPIFSDHAGPFSRIGPKRVHAPGLAFEHLPAIDLVLLSHNHYDHMDLATLRRLRERGNPKIVTGLGNAAYLAGKGIVNVVELDWWETIETSSDARITYVPAQHWSRRGLFDHRRSLWGGHAVRTPAGLLLFAGDTGYGTHFAEIRDRLGPPDIALLPIGAYEPRWFMEAQHMNPDDAVRAHLDLRANLSIAMHFGTFQLTDEAIDAPVHDLDAARRRHGVAEYRFRVPGFGETITWTSAMQNMPLETA